MLHLYFTVFEDYLNEIDSEYDGSFCEELVIHCKLVWVFLPKSMPDKS